MLVKNINMVNSGYTKKENEVYEKVLKQYNEYLSEGFKRKNPWLICIAANIAQIYDLGLEKDKEAAGLAYIIYMDKGNFKKAIEIAKNFDLGYELMENAVKGYMKNIIKELREKYGLSIDQLKKIFEDCI